jgi:putative transcriptional regulator
VTESLTDESGLEGEISCRAANLFVKHALHPMLLHGLLPVYDMKEVIHNCVYDERYAREITQEELAQTVGVTRQTIIALEKGNYTPSILLALKIASFFKMPVEKLFNISYEK